jgi:hypothetical protein
VIDRWSHGVHLSTKERQGKAKYKTRTTNTPQSRRPKDKTSGRRKAPFHFDVVIFDFDFVSQFFFFFDVVIFQIFHKDVYKTIDTYT